LAACRAPRLFTGPQLYEQLLKVEFEGASGKVTFDEYGNRASDGVQYRVDNLLLSEKNSDALHFRFETSLAAVIGGPNITEVNPFIFASGIQTPPADLPPVDMDFKLIPSWGKSLGYALGSSLIILSFTTIVWTWRKREMHVVKAAQPPFLVQICVGILIMATSIFPMSLGGGGEDEVSNPWKYNAACQSTMWLLCLGFVVSFSAIFSKTLRLNKVMNAGAAIRRIQVDAKDVMRPFAALITINVVMLLGLTFVAPYKYSRVEVDNYDQFGRSVESYGKCKSSSNLSYAFAIPMTFANTFGVVMAAWQCYRARNLPMDFTEHHYLGKSMAFLMETVFLGAPVVFALRGEPTADYIFVTIAVCFVCLSIHLPVFLPKFLNLHFRKQQLQLGGGGRAAVNLIAQHTTRFQSNQISTYGIEAKTKKKSSSNLDLGLSSSSNEDENESRSVSSRSSRGRMAIIRKR